MKVKAIENDKQLEVTINARDKFNETIGNLLSGDIPASQAEQLLRDTQADSLISVRDELDAVIKTYQDKLKA